MYPKMLLTSAVLAALPVSRSLADDVVVSLSGSGKLPNFNATDEDLLVHSPGQPALPYLTAEGISFFMGDVNGNGLFDDRDDVDALDIDLRVDPPQIRLSFLGDIAPFKDGDIIELQPSGGTSIYLSEADLITAIGAKDGNIDIDAIAINPADGGLYFSVGEDEESNFLSGSVPGFVLAEEVLFLPKGGPLASVAYTQADIQGLVAHALNTAPFDVQDLLSLGVAQNGAIYFSIQTPSDQDATIFSTEQGGIIVPGHQELDFGFSNAAELDAIACVTPAPSFPALQLVPEAPDLGQTLEFHSFRGTPGGAYQILISGATQDAMAYRMPGFVGLYPSIADPLFMAGVGISPYLSGSFGSTGDGLLSIATPAGSFTADIVVQLIELPGLKVSHPIWMELNQ